MRRNNKGFTLVELLVAMAVMAIVMLEIMSLLSNTSRLYKKGTSEVDLQTEAQRVIQVTEALLIDANVSISVNDIPGLVGSNIITISSNNVSENKAYEYTIALDMTASPTADYGNVVLTVNNKTDGTTSSQILAEYVKSISLNMADYETADKVTLSIEMQNTDYSYSELMIKDIYLRNQIGSDGNKPAAVLSAANYNIDCLRYKEYNLIKVLDSSARKNANGHYYIFRFVDPTNNSKDYSLTMKADDQWILKCQPVIESNFGKTPQCQIEVVDPDTSATVAKINVTTDAVKIGMGATCTSGTTATGNSVCYFQAGGESSAVCATYIEVKGIAVDYASISSECEIGSDFPYVSEITTGLDMGTEKTIDVKFWPTSSLSGGKYYNFEVYNCKWDVDPVTNSIVLYAGKYNPTSNEGGIGKTYSQLLEEDGGVFEHITLTYEEGVTVSTKAFLVAVSASYGSDVAAKQDGVNADGTSDNSSFWHGL